MPIFGLTKQLAFPPTDLADESGVLAVGGDLSPSRLLLAYQQGIFPWPHEGYPLLWFCPKDRFVLEPKNIHIGRSLKKEIRNSNYEIKFDTCFSEVMRGCQSAKRDGQNQTWITTEMIQGYSRLHELGYAHSIEAFGNHQLIGGLYGVSLGGIFFGESMFATKKNASKIAFVTLVAHLIQWNFDLIDCQSQTDHLERFGAHFVPRDEFLARLQRSQKKATRQGKWSCQLDSAQVLSYISDACVDE